MNEFEQTELQDIIGPIPPDAPVHWYLYVGGFLGIILCLAGFFLLHRFRRKLFKDSPERRSKRMISQLKKSLKPYEGSEETLEHADLDAWWSQMLQIWMARKWIDSATLTLEELDSRFNKSHNLEAQDQKTVRELIQLMDIHKFQGGLDGKQRSRAVKSLKRVLQIIEKG